MDCVIRVIKGPGEGEEFRCSGGETVIGRSPRSQVRLASPGVSYEHAVIRRTGSEFFVENLSAGGTFVNDEKIAGKVRLRAKDELRLGPDTVVRVEAIPSGGSAESRKRRLIWAVVVMILAAVAVVVIDPFSGSTSSGDWKGAYAKLDAWTSHEVEEGNLPVETPTILHDAWRFDRAGNRAESTRQWLRLAVLLDHEDERLGLRTAAGKYRKALDQLLKPDTRTSAEPMSDEEMGAGLVQFVSAMGRKK